MPQQYADVLDTKSCKVADICGERILNDVSIEGQDPSIYHSRRHYWSPNPQADFTDIAF